MCAISALMDLLKQLNIIYLHIKTIATRTNSTFSIQKTSIHMYVHTYTYVIYEKTGVGHTPVDWN